MSLKNCPDGSLKSSVKLALKKWISDESGQSTTEYILILSVVLLVGMRFKKVFEKMLVGAVESLGNRLGNELRDSGGDSP
jgi:Flp pilus assembly pilin Flp